MRRGTALKAAIASLAMLLAALGAAAWVLWLPATKEPPYVMVAAWGELGTGPGQFSDPTGIAATDAVVYVSDARNGRVQVFNHDGLYLREIGVGGDGAEALARPMNLTIAGAELYVADFMADRIAVFDLDGHWRRDVGRPGSGEGEFDAPGGVAVGPNGDLYVADFYNQRIQRLAPDGRFIRQWGRTREAGSRSGRFNYPTDVALGPDGTLYVADGYNDRVQAFAADGANARRWGGPFGMNVNGPFNGWFSTVTSIEVDAAGDVFVADFYNHRIQKFAPDGTFLTAFGRRGDRVGEMTFPNAVAVAPNGSVFVADFGNNRIQKWVPGERGATP